MRIGIVGGGPGGLMTARLVESFANGQADVTLIESSERLGGKVVTRQFAKAPVVYEAGVAELYDYSHLGPDPVKELILGLGLEILPISGPAVVLGEKILRDDKDILRLCGPATLKALDDFYNECRRLFTPEEYYEGHSSDDNIHPWAGKTWRDVLDEIPDETARKYVMVASKSDVATEPGLTSALDGLKNILMDDPAYLRLYSIVGGNELLTKKIAAGLTSTKVRLNTAAKRVSRNDDGTLRLTVRHDGRNEELDFDSIVLALPNYWLEGLEWGNRELRLAMDRHLAHYAYPAHYLRVSILFEKPFWREAIPGDFFMSDAFGGCCVYDEGRRHPCDPYGVLGWLLAGNDAMALGNLTDETLIKMALDSLPDSMAAGRATIVEGRVQRWIGTINGLPGGNPVHSLKTRHMPEPVNHSGLLVVGDYMFDSTLNGVYDSADYATDLILTQMRKLKYADQVRQNASAEDLEEEDDFDAEYIVKMIETVWGAKAPYKLLDCGSGAGQSLAEFEDCEVEAWGVEINKQSHARAPKKWLERNLLCDMGKLPFPDKSFDFVHAANLCYLPEDKIDAAIQELFRVCRVGVLMQGVATDMTPEVIEEYELLVGVQTHWTLWEWSEAFVKNGFRMSISDTAVLDEVWRLEQATDEDDWNWYPDRESMRYTFFSKPEIEPRRLSPPTPEDALPRTPIPHAR